MVRTRPRRSTIGPAENPGERLAGGERGEEQRGDRGGLSMVVPHRQGEPVVRRTLAEFDTEHDDADEQQPPVQPAAQPLAQPGPPGPRGGCAAGPRLPCGIPAAVPRAAAAMSTASPMSCAEGLMPRAAQAAPIPDPTATPIDQAACIIGIRVRPAACSTAAPSTLISTSRVPIPAARDHEADRDQRNRTQMSARPMTAHRGGDEQQRSRDGPAAAQPVQDRGRRRAARGWPRRSLPPGAARSWPCRCRGPS